MASKPVSKAKGAKKQKVTVNLGDDEAIHLLSAQQTMAKANQGYVEKIHEALYSVAVDHCC